MIGFLSRSQWGKKKRPSEQLTTFYTDARHTTQKTEGRGVNLNS